MSVTEVMANVMLEAALLTSRMSVTEVMANVMLEAALLTSRMSVTEVMANFMHQHQEVLVTSDINLYTGWPNKNRTFLRYHIFAATADIIMRFLQKCSEVTSENNKQQIF